MHPVHRSAQALQRRQLRCLWSTPAQHAGPPNAPEIKALLLKPPDSVLNAYCRLRSPTPSAYHLRATSSRKALTQRRHQATACSKRQCTLPEDKLSTIMRGWQDTFTYRVKGVRVLPVPGVVVDLQAGRHVPSSQHWGAHLDWHIVRPAHDASLPGREHDQLPASGEQVNPAASVEMGPSCER